MLLIDLDTCNEMLRGKDKHATGLYTETDSREFQFLLFSMNRNSIYVGFSFTGYSYFTNIF